MTIFKIEEVNIESIIVAPDRSRKVFDGIQELAISIQKVGLLNPILITDEFLLLGGERRLRAYKQMDLTTIPCRVLSGIDPSDYDIIEYIENKERKDFLWHEELEIKLKMHTRWAKSNPKWNYRKSAEKLSVSLGGLSSDLELAKIIQVFPDLKASDTKGKAREGYKKLAQQAEAMQAIETLPAADKTALVEMLRGPVKTGVEQGVNSGHGGGKSGVIRDEKSPATLNPTDEKTPSKPANSALPDHAYRICDCFELLSEVPDNSVGFCELDPPYAMDFNTLGIYANDQMAESDWSFEKYGETMQKLLPVLYDKMLTKSFVLCWTAHAHAFWTNQLAAQYGFKTQLPGIWCKPSGSSIRPNQNMVSNYEMFILLAKDNAVFNTKSFKACLNHSSVPFSEKTHQWEKPTEMYKEFFDALGKPGSIFLSPFAGSGNSMLVAAQTGMIPVGCDLNQKYYYTFMKRFNNHFGGV